MRVLLMRHGEAVPDSEFDESRHLTTRGRSDSEKCAIHLATALLRESSHARVALSVSSHLVRAVQTAELVMSALRMHGVEVADFLEADPALAPEAPASFALERLKQRAKRMGEAHLLVVCHEPIIRGIASGITGRASYAPFVTSGCACFEDATERFAVSPEGRVR